VLQTPGSYGDRMIAKGCPNADADFIAHARTDIPALVAELRALNYREELRGLVEWMDTDLDNNVADRYKEQPFAQDWARVAKVAEETGEAIDALIGWTGQNPRKGVYCAPENLHEELCDVALTGLYALQHFLKDGDKTMNALLARARYHRQRRES
jgi:hypothetical protein